MLDKAVRVRTPGDVETRGVYRAIVDRLAQRLRDRSSVMAVGEGLDSEFERNVIGILDEAVRLMHDSRGASAVAIEYSCSASPEFDRTGRMRAEQNVHPAESLMAAEVLFDVALPILVDDRNLTPDTSAGALVAARALHHAIWRRFPPGAIAYADTLRQRLSTAHQESRQRLSRDLHDRVAHTIAAGIQRVELASTVEDVPDASQRSLAEATVILRSALTDVRDLSVELRSRVGHLTVDEAIRRYVKNTSLPRPAVAVQGAPRPLRAWVAEELFAIIVEAIRNSREYAGPATSVAFAWSANTLAVTVSDEGPGFNPNSVRPSAIGLADMAERAAMIGARFAIDTAPGQGTMITVVVPLDVRAGADPS